MPARFRDRRVVLALRAVVVCAFALVAVVAAGPSPSARSAPPKKKPKPTPPQVFVAPTGSDSGRCTSTRPCLTFDRAYHVAAPGQVVSVAAGVYPSQTVTADSRKTASQDVLFRPPKGARVEIQGELRVEGSHVTFANMVVDDWYVGINDTVPQTSQPTDVTFDHVVGHLFFITGASAIRVRGGSYGNVENDAPEIKNCADCDYVVNNIVIDGVTFHDYVRTEPGVHMECLHIYPAQQLTLRNSRFRNCAIMDVFLNNYGAGYVKDILIENNFFDTPGSRGGSLSEGSYAINFDNFGGKIENVLIRNNSFLATAHTEVGPFLTNFRFIGNVGYRSQFHCYDGVVFSHNVWTDARCSRTDRRAQPGFINPQALKLCLKRRSPAINRGDPKNYPKRDILGRKRPKGKAPDAGACESG